MPGTLNIAHTIPTIAEFLLFLELIKIEGLTLVTLIAGAAIGAVFGASIVSKWSPKVIRIGLGTALLILAGVLSCKLAHIGPFESTMKPTAIVAELEANGFTIGEDINLVHAPERIIPGNMVYELIHNNRTVGADSKEIGEKVKSYYASFCQGEIVVTDIRSAEMSKVVENTYRAVNIAFANELSRICRHDNMDVYEIIKICNMHPRVNILQPGPGVGGHCISVDPWFLVGDYPQLAKVIDESMKTNDSQPTFVLNRIYEIMKENNIADNRRVGLYGLTYKENVDDFRESPTLQLLENQERHLARPLKCYDPYLENLKIAENQYFDFDEFLKDIDMVVIMVKHDQIKESWDKLKGKVIMDCFNICPLEGTYHI